NTTPDAYQDPDIVSIRLYTCQDGQSTSPSTINNNPPEGDCRLRLAAIPVTKGQLPPGIQQRNISDTPVSALPREIQVALGNNPAGFISQPFFMDGALYVAELTNRVRGRLPDLEEVRQDALFNYRQHQRQAILRTLLDLP